MAIARRHAARWTQVFCRQIRTPSCERLDMSGFSGLAAALSAKPVGRVPRQSSARAIMVTTLCDVVR